MRLDNLKKSFFGYQKTSVLHLVSSMDEEFSQKLAMQQEKHDREIEEYKKRISEFEAALNAAKEENKSSSTNQMIISDAIISAQEYVWQLKEESLKQQQEAQLEIREEMQKKNKELEVYTAKIHEIRESIVNLLKYFDDQAEQLEEQANNIKEESTKYTIVPLFNRQNRKEQG